MLNFCARDASICELEESADAPCTNVHTCTTESCNTKLYASRACSIKHSTGTTRQDSMANDETVFICTACCGCTTCTTRGRKTTETDEKGRTPLSSPHQQGAGTATSSQEGAANRNGLETPERTTAVRKEREGDADKSAKSTANNSVTTFKRFMWFQHLRVNPHCRWRSLEDNKASCDISNCKCTPRKQDTRMMTDVVCNDKQAFVDLGFHEIPAIRQAISEWCEQNSEAWRSLI